MSEEVISGRWDHGCLIFLFVPLYVQLSYNKNAGFYNYSQVKSEHTAEGPGSPRAPECGLLAPGAASPPPP